MRKATSASWIRMVLAFAAILLVAGPGFVLAGGGFSAYVPKSSVLKGPAFVPASGTANYVLEVTFTNGAVGDYPPHTGATFSSVRGSITSGGVYSAPATTGKDKVSGSLTQNGVTVTSSRIILVQ